MTRVLNIPGAFAINPAAPELIKSFQNWAYAVDKKGEVQKGKDPKHDHNSHRMKALLYLVAYLNDGDKGLSRRRMKSRDDNVQWDFNVFSKGRYI